MAAKVGIIGGGIIGLALAYKLQLHYPGTKVILFEKEAELGLHQSGRNSGVLHCGLYYEPGSLKARLAVAGIREMTAFCREHHIEHDICGKVVVAADDREIAFLKNLHARGQANGLTGLRYLNRQALKAREPFVAAKEVLLVPEEGIVDYKAVMQTLATLILRNGAEIHPGTEIGKVEERQAGIVVRSHDKEWVVDHVIACAGLHSDRVYQQLTRKERPLRIVPFRGEYMMLTKEASHLVNHLVYPVPDPKYPFLGVHFTRMVSGAKEVGPNAVFALKREGYRNRDFSLRDTLDAATYKGFLSFLTKNLAFSMGEFYSSVNPAAFLAKAKKMVPDIELSHFTKGTAGVRAQAMDPAGKLIMDFRVVREGRQIHVLNAPSPGATASLAIADHILKEYFM